MRIWQYARDTDLTSEKMWLLSGSVTIKCLKDPTSHLLEYSDTQHTAVADRGGVGATKGINSYFRWDHSQAGVLLLGL